MKNKLSFILIVTFILLIISCKNEEKRENKVEKKYFSNEIGLKVDSATIYGTLQMPDSVGTFPVVLIIAGSGPTDRNGNNKLGVKGAPYRMLADSLSAHKIATLRYDKRLIGKSQVNGFFESDLRFDTYVNDAQEWIKLLKSDKRFTKVIVLGHSEGSLIGAIASLREKPDKFISLAGVGRPIDSVLIEQLSHANFDMKEVNRIIKKIKAGRIVIVPDNMKTIFRVTVQPYLSSWFQYNPREIFSELQMPVLILQGTTDIQVSEKDAKVLHSACKQSKLVLIKGMNHILKNASMDTTKNMATYFDPQLPLNQNLVLSIVDFVNK